MNEILKVRVRQEIVHTLTRIEDKIVPGLIPDEGITLAYAISGARSSDDVGFANFHQLMKYDENKDNLINFGSSNRIISVILTAIRISPDIRCVCSIRFSEELIKICDEMLLDMSIYNEEKIPPGVSTMDWAVAFCGEQESGIPDIICIRNKNPQGSHAWLFGENPLQITTNLLKISQRIIDATH